MKQISIEGMKFYAYHGYYKEERQKGNYFIVDIRVDVDFDKAAKRDSIVGTIDYVKVFRICQKEMKKKRKLLETVAYNIGEQVKNKFDEAKKVKVKVSKLNPPLDDFTDKFAVIYTCKRK